MGKIIEIIGEETEEVNTAAAPIVEEKPAAEKKDCACAARKARIALTENAYCKRIDRVGRLQEVTAIIFLCTAILAFIHWIRKSN